MPNRAQAPSWAQGTIEYLVILAVVVVVALVVVNLMIQSTAPAQGITGTTSQIASASTALAITEAIVDTDGNYFLKIKNNTGENITITKIEIGDNTPATPYKPIPQNAEEAFILSTDDICSEGQLIVNEIIVTYTNQYDLTKKQTYPVPINFECETFTATVTYTDEEGATHEEDGGIIEPPAGPDCGNEVIDAGEECDGLNLDGKDCLSQGYDGGTLACSACSFNYSNCTMNSVTLSTYITDFSGGTFTNTKIGSVVPDGELSTPLDASLIAYYKFNGDADDETSNGKNGTIKNEAVTSGEGLWGTNALTLDGDNDFVEVVSPMDNYTNQFSVSAWVKRDAESGQETIFASGNYRLSITPVNKVQFEITDGTETGTTLFSNINSVLGGTYASFDGVYDENILINTIYDYHLWAYDGSNFTKIWDSDNHFRATGIYRNELYKGHSNGHVYKYNGVPLSWADLGLVCSGTSMYANAFVKFGDRLITACATSGEVIAYNGSTWVSLGNPATGISTHDIAVYNGELYAGTGSGAVDTGKVFKYTGNFAGTNSWNQVGGVVGGLPYASDLTIFKGQLYAIGKSSASGNPTQVFKYEGGDWVAVSASGYTTGTTMAVYANKLYGLRDAYGGAPYGVWRYDSGTSWTKVSPYDDSQNKRSSGTKSNTFDGKLYTLNGNSRVMMTLGDGFTFSSSERLGTEWTHIMATYDGSVGKLYVNGALVAQESKTLTLSTISENWYIGNGYGNDYQGEENFGGKIDEVKVWNEALDPTEVLADYGEWFDGSYEHTIIDLGGAKDFEYLEFNTGGNSSGTTAGHSRVGIQYKACDDSACVGEVWSAANYNSNTQIDLSAETGKQWFTFATDFEMLQDSGNYYPTDYAVLEDVNIVYTG